MEDRINQTTNKLSDPHSIFTLREIARQWPLLSYDTLKRSAAGGDIKVVRLRGRLLVPCAELRRVLGLPAIASAA